MSARVPVSILGATGTVGQRLVALLDGHPRFEVVSVVASARSAGRAYGEAVHWRLPGEPPPSVAGIEVTAADDTPAEGARLALSSLDPGIARDTEERFARAGVLVVSNASPHRMVEDVPLVVPEVNGDHLALLDAQKRYPDGGGIVCNPNCSTIGLTLALAPLHRAFGVEAVEVTTLQAASGAGYPGVPSTDLIDNVVPLIPGEEEKLAEESAKILGRLAGRSIEFAALQMSAQCFRVPVTDGHTASVSVRLGRRPKNVEELVGAWRAFAAEHGGDGEPPLVISEAPDRPQPRLDRDAGAGMSATIGRTRRCPVLGWRFVVLSHNTIRGAAGGTLKVAEALAAGGRL